jgi:MYXO-CTERM domain-containing protein
MLISAVVFVSLSTGSSPEPVAIGVPAIEGVEVEYPLAMDFVSAHPSNYVAGGMDTPQHVIIHQMDGTYQSTLYWFQDPVSDVSTHYIMRSIDGAITQMVRHEDMGQHIGGYNPISFGIEHEGFIYEPGWFTWESYVASAQLTRWLCDHFAIPADRDHILGHVEVPGASHTDPGPYWSWDMYMALVHDVVPEGRVEGVLVDATQPCTITATADTWITTTLESLDALDEDEQCFLAAGTELSYLHASDEMISQSRLTMGGGGPCAGIGELDTQAYVWLPSFGPLCAVAEIAAHETVTVALDGVETMIDAQGHFAFEGVAQGAHTIDVSSNGAWQATSVPIDVAVYPGLRVVVPIEPDADEPDDLTTSGADETDDGGEAGSGDVGSGSATDDGPLDPTGAGDGVEPGSSDGESSPDADDRGASPGGCGCRATHDRPRAALALLVALAGALRRRSRRR